MENGPPSDVRFDKSVAASTRLERFSLSLVCDEAGSVVRVHPKEMILNCCMQLAVERVLCLDCAC